MNEMKVSFLSRSENEAFARTAVAAFAATVDPTVEQLNEVKTEKSELESKVDALNREINELNKKISSLSGN